MPDGIDKFSILAANIGGPDFVGAAAGCQRHIGFIFAQCGIGDQPTRLAYLVHHTIAGVDAQRTGNAFKLLPVPDVDAHGTDGNAGIAVHAISHRFPGSNQLFRMA
ncbi:hypothetical protein D3C80_1364110 [compost metagenome]